MDIDNLIDNIFILKNRKLIVIKNQKIKHKKIYGLGFITNGKYNSINYKKAYNIWRSLFSKCYDNKYKLKNKQIEVDPLWYDFQNFAKWYHNNYIPGLKRTNIKFKLVNFLIDKNAKFYGPNTCCFIPEEILPIINCSCKANRGKYPIGVHKLRNNKFGAILTKENKPIYLGSFYSIEEAFQVYKEAKEEYIQSFAYKYYFELNEKIFQALINYQVEITD